MVRVCAAALASMALAASVLAQPAALEVDFSEPTQAAVDVRLDTRIRIHFSRDVVPASLKDRVRVTYSQADSRERGEAEPPRVRFATHYDGRARVLEICPSQRLERFRQVQVELLEGIVGADGSALKPWTLNFTTGGS
jgi:hypothetical protein